MKIHTEQTLKIRNGAGEDYKSANSNNNRFMGDTKMRMANFHLGGNPENTQYSNVKKDLRNFQLCNSACNDYKLSSKSSESIESSHLAQQRPYNISNFPQVFQPTGFSGMLP